MATEPTEVETGTERWMLIRDVLVFQCKLLVDGFRDLVLLPVSLLAGIVSLVGKGPESITHTLAGRSEHTWHTNRMLVASASSPNAAAPMPPSPNARPKKCPRDGADPLQILLPG